MITVRPAVLGDAEAMSDLLVASITALCVADHGNRPDAVVPWLANKTPEGERKWFANAENRLFVAEHSGALAATGGCNTKREIILNYVSPEHRSPAPRRRTASTWRVAGLMRARSSAMRESWPIQCGRRSRPSD